jgi:mRNA interferase MazF
VSAAAYVLDAGDIVWLDFSPQSGHEQAGRGPAVVLSPAAYNRFGLMLCCPMTTRVKGYPFEVSIAGDRGGVVLADQIKSLDWKVRNAQRKGAVSAAELSQIRAKSLVLIGKP